MKRKDIHAQRTALGRLLRTIREERGLRQQEVAERLGQPQSFVSKYENAERRLDLPELRHIAGILETPLDWLLKRFEQIIDD